MRSPLLDEIFQPARALTRAPESPPRAIENISASVRGKIAIVLSGGGMKCSYGVGVLVALLEKFHLAHPDMLIAASGSAGTGSYFVSEQYRAMVNIWANLLSTEEFIDLSRMSRMIDIDYLIDEVFKRREPLDIDGVRRSPIHYLIPATHAVTGDLRYFSNRDGVDIFEAMRATKAMPVSYGKRVAIDGEPYCDSYTSSTIELNILQAVALGAQKILAVDATKRGPSVSRTVFEIWLRLQREQFRRKFAECLDARRNYQQKIPDNTRVLVLKPKKKLPVGTLSNNQRALQDAIQQGYEEAYTDGDLEKFLAA